MSDLWAQERADRLSQASPLADRMRPVELDDVVGQEPVLGQGSLLRRLIVSDRMGSVLLWGPPGTGKTTIASLIAHQTGRRFISANAAMIGVKDIRDAIDSSRRHIESGEKATILFLDEIHRFSRSQQDVLLGDVERGIITLIGATTENPWYAVNAALAKSFDGVSSRVLVGDRHHHDSSTGGPRGPPDQIKATGDIRRGLCPMGETLRWRCPACLECDGSRGAGQHGTVADHHRKGTGHRIHPDQGIEIRPFGRCPLRPHQP